MLPSTVLEYGLIPPMAFGLTEETVDEGRNLITITISDARRLMTRAGISPMVPMTADYESALAKITLSLLLRHYAANKARFTGYQIGRSGRTQTPLGSHEELLAAAADYYAQAKDIYPDADWPTMDVTRTAGVIEFTRSF